MAKHRRQGHDHDRHQVRPAAVRPARPDGEPEGFDVEIGKIIAAELGIADDKIKWVETVSANREPFIQDGKVDIVVATYTINDERKEIVDFAGPYFVAGQTILVKEANTDINGPDDLAGKTVCSVEGSTPAANIEENYPDVELELTDAYSNCLEPLRNDQVDAITTDNVILAGFVDQNEGEFKLVGEPFTEEPYGIGLKKDDTAFRTFINDVLEESFEDGSWADGLGGHRGRGPGARRSRPRSTGTESRTRRGGPLRERWPTRRPSRGGGEHVDALLDNLPLTARRLPDDPAPDAGLRAFALVLGTLLGAVPGLTRADPARFGTVYVELLRNTPLTLVFFFFVFVAPQHRAQAAVRRLRRTSRCRCTRLPSSARRCGRASTASASARPRPPGRSG